MFGWYEENGTVYGSMPDGNVDPFESVEQYEDAYCDRLYELDNGYEFEYPERVA